MQVLLFYISTLLLSSAKSILIIHRQSEKVNRYALLILDLMYKEGYFRKGLIVLSDLPSEKIAIDAFLAHECGHIWATGANINSWEDWLNETFAEILSL